jgi:hypothetical protein
MSIFVLLALEGRLTLTKFLVAMWAPAGLRAWLFNVLQLLAVSLSAASFHSTFRNFDVQLDVHPTSLPHVYCSEMFCRPSVFIELGLPVPSGLGTVETAQFRFSRK